MKVFSTLPDDLRARRTVSVLLRRLVRVGEIIDESLKQTDCVSGKRCEASVNVPRAALGVGIG